MFANLDFSVSRQFHLYLALLALLVVEQVESRSAAELKNLRMNLIVDKPYPGTSAVFRQIPPTILKYNFEWTKVEPAYDPANYTDSSIAKNPSWADNPADLGNIIFNAVDGGVNRRSYEGKYTFEPEGRYAGRPRNPAGRTGIAGRGLFGRFGPNHAVDVLPIRYNPELYKCSGASEGEKLRNPACYQILLITRGDTGDYYPSPGAMTDPISHLDGVLHLPEETIVTCVRGFMEKTMDTKGLASKKIRLSKLVKTHPDTFCSSMTWQEKKDARDVAKFVKSTDQHEADLKELNLIRTFMRRVVSGGNFVQIYEGYTDDWRNTDHAWKETVCFLLKCDPDFSKFLDDHITEGDDAASVGWYNLTKANDQDFKFFASQRDYAEIIIRLIESGEYITGAKDPQTWGQRIKAAAGTVVQKIFGK